ncbi:hypothetical protein QFZ34_000810 [Phyllobacterium ifriqiyense]|uniref:Uncharacterized protein n=1 Tax=Phyllobacterium ifriqiyense TaxID=314238 RepID=A0ABU0S7E3_9HYPH|nr:hypothetical protein [Phyllobacterium ifriqiyense]
MTLWAESPELTSSEPMTPYNTALSVLILTNQSQSMRRNNAAVC